MKAEQKKERPEKLLPEEIANLGRLSRRGDRIALRARGILLLSEGMSQGGVARTLCVAVTTVRAWRRRWRDQGLEALGLRTGRHGADAAVDSIAGLPVTLAPVQAALLCGKRAGRGRPATSRTAIETWIRDGAALGLFAPGCRLPGRAWLQKRFGASAHTIAESTAALGRQGFVRNVPRIGSFVARTLPFENRYLLLLSTAGQGLDAALESAARAQETRRGVHWTIVAGLTRGGPVLGGVPAQIAAQKWAGVFLRTSPSEAKPGWEFLSLGRVPMSGFLAAGPWLGAHAVPLEGNYGQDDSIVFAAIRRAGRRRVLVVDATGRGDSGDAEGRAATVRRTVASFGLSIPDCCYQQLDPSEREQARLILPAVLRLAREERIDSVAVLQDNFVDAVCAGLIDTFGREAAASTFVAAFGHRPQLRHSCLPVEWHGQDIAATLDSFVDWCDAIHAGAKSPPPPELATF